MPAAGRGSEDPPRDWIDPQAPSRDAAHSMESVHLQHLLVDGAFLPDAIPPDAARVASRVGEIVRFATRHRSGATIAIPIACRKRPDRRACGGFLAVYRQDTPAVVRWQCPRCADGGVITGWQGTEFDLRALAAGRVPVEHVEFSSSFHSVLGSLGRCSAECAAAVYGSSLVDDRIMMPVPQGRRSELAGRALHAAVAEGSGTKAARLIDLAAELGERAVSGGAGAEVVDLGAVPAATLAELLSTFEVEEHRAVPRQPDTRRRTRKRRASRDPRTFVLGITLRDVEPRAWRRIEVPADIELPELHDVLQVAMGWTDSHLHAFVFGSDVFSPLDPDLEAIGADTAGVALSTALGGSPDSFQYDYDFGDGWRHEVVVEAIRDEECRAVRCTAGEGACPPEDVGGAGGYEQMLEALADPRHEEHAMYAEWLGRRFDPTEFDVAAVDARLRTM